MDLEFTYSSLDDIPEQYQDLYTQKGDAYEFTGVKGIKTEADIQRLDTSLKSERAAHKATKDKLASWSEFDHADVVAKLDRYPELEAAAAGKLDDAEIDKIVDKRVSGKINSATAPLERKLKKATEENAELAGKVSKFEAADTRRTIHDDVRKELLAQKVRPEAHDDALLLSDRVFEVNEEGKTVTRDGVGVTPGIDAAGWLQEIQPRKVHWWPDSVGGNARGSGGGGNFGGKNPFTAEGWNMTEQGRIYREKGQEVAERLAKAAGTTVGGPRPTAKA